MSFFDRAYGSDQQRVGIIAKKIDEWTMKRRAENEGQREKERERIVSRNSDERCIRQPAPSSLRSRDRSPRASVI